MRRGWSWPVCLLSVSTQPQPNEEGTLQVNHLCATAFRGRNLYGMVTRREAYACASRGQIETDMNQRIETILRARNIPFN